MNGKSVPGALRGPLGMGRRLAALISLAAIAAFLFAGPPAEALGKRNRGEVPEDRAADVGVDDDSVPVDLGWGPRPGPSARKSIGPTSGIQTSAEGFQEFDAAALAGGANAHTEGVFGEPFTWPIIPIHVTLLPDGKVYSYGTSTTGAQGAALVHDLWDPELGTAGSAHTLLPIPLPPTPSAPPRRCSRTAANS